MAIPEALEKRLRIPAKNRCGYCQSQQRYNPIPLEIDHIIPKSKGGTNEEGNLWLACRQCNNYKGTQTDARDPVTGEMVSLFDPCRQIWKEHFCWDEPGAYILGKTKVGRATVVALQLNNLHAVEARQNWVAVGWHPPHEE